MKIAVHPVGRYKEIAFHDFETDDVARSGLLNEEEALELAQRLREVAAELSCAQGDEGQIWLPFVGERAA